MLPMMILQSSDIALFDKSLNSAELLPQEPLQDGVAFAAVLESGLELTRDYEQISGTLLPQYGKELPAENLEPATTSPVGLFNVFVEDSIVELFGPPMIPVSLTAAIDDNLPVTLSTPVPLPTSVANLTLPAGHPLSPETPVSASSPGTATITPQLPTREAIVVPHESIISGKSPLQLPQVAVAPEKPLPRIVNDMEIRLAEESGVHERRVVPDAASIRKLAMNESAASTNGKVATPYDPESPLDTTREVRLPQVPVASSPAAQATITAANSYENSLGQAPQTSALTASPQVVQTAAQSGTESSGQPSPALQTIDVPVKSSGWGEQIGERVLLMTNNRLQSAEIRLTPAELGPVRVRLAVEDGAANVTFLAQNAITREALEQAMPRLRELLAENGLTLNQADIAEHGENSDGGVQQGKDGRDDAAATAQASTEADDDSSQSGLATASTSGTSHDGLVDTFV